MREGSTGNKVPSQSSVNGDSGAPSPADRTSAPRVPLRGNRASPPSFSAPDPPPHPNSSTEDKCLEGVVSAAPTESVTTSAPSDGASSSDGAAAALIPGGLIGGGGVVERAVGGDDGGGMEGASNVTAIEGERDVTCESSSASGAERRDMEGSLNMTASVGSDAGVNISYDMSEPDPETEEEDGGPAADAAAAIAAATAMFARTMGIAPGSVNVSVGERAGHARGLAGEGTIGGGGMRETSSALLGSPDRARRLSDRIKVTPDNSKGSPDLGKREKRPSSLRQRNSGASEGGGGGLNTAGGGQQSTRNSVSGVSASLRRATASSISRLRLSAPPVPAFDGGSGGVGGLETTVSRTTRRTG